MARPMRPADLHDLRTVGTVALRPGSDNVVFTLGWPDLESDSNRAQLWVHSGDGNRQLTHGHADTKPVFSPSGSRLAFIRSAPKSKPCLMVLDWGPGEPREVGEFPDGVSTMRWIDDHRLAVVAVDRPEDQVGMDDDEVARRPRVVRSQDYRFNGRGWTNDRKLQIHVTDIESGDQHRVSNPDLDHGDVAVDPSGEWLATVVGSDDDSDQTGVAHIWVCRIDGTDAHRVTTTRGVWGGLCWHPEGPLLAVGHPDASRIGFSVIHRFDRSGADWSQPARLGDGDVNIDTFGGASLVAVDDAVLAPGNVSGATVIDRVPLDGSPTDRIHHGLDQVRSFDSSPDGLHLVAAITSPTRPADLWLLAGGGANRLTDLNRELLDQLDLAVPETVTVRSADGTDVEAWMYRPPATAPGRGNPGPGLVYIHGGPMTQYGYGFFDEFQLAAAEGFTVIAGNPRGSDGYGENWATCIVGHLGEDDWADVAAIADHLAALPEIDENRIGIGGGSYGGYMTAWAIGHTNGFRAALVERPVTNWETFGGTTDIPFLVSLYLDATIEGDVDSVRRQSPITYAAAVTTPTLILHSEEDWRCPIEQSEQFFAALRRNGCDVTLARFPGENHDLSRTGSPRHRIERFEIVHDFFHAHLG